MAAGIEQPTRVRRGHFASVIGESRKTIQEALRDQRLAQGMRLVATHTREVMNQAFLVKAVKRQVVYVFGCGLWVPPSP